jgi:hypothetical protein
MDSLSVPVWLSEYDNDAFAHYNSIMLTLVTPSVIPTTSPKLKEWEDVWHSSLEKYYALENPTDYGPVYSTLRMGVKTSLVITDCEKILGGEQTLFEVELNTEELCECTRIFLLSRRQTDITE